MTSQGPNPEKPAGSGRNRFVVASMAAMVASVAAYWVFLVLPLATSRDFSWANFRNYFDYDQYSYLAIAVNVSNGNLDNVEPFTVTGASHYPRLYYVVLGLIARVFNADIIATWQVVGLVFQGLMVLAVSWLLIRLTHRAVLGIFGFVPSMIGVLAVPISKSWYHPLENHGVLWGPFGTMFTLNGEAAGMAAAVVAACVLIGVTFPRSGRSAGRYTTAAVAIGACVVVGTLANVQTYSFLTAVYFLAYIAAAFGLTHFGNRRHAFISVALLAAVLLGGASVAGAWGPLAALVAGLAGSVPGVLLLLKRYPAVVGGSAVGMAVAAAPTIVATLSGMAQEDEFLEYRALSSVNLGVPFPLGLIGAAVPALFLAIIFRAGLKTSNKAWLSLPIGVAVAWPVIAINDLWGANQEPYRFWIDGFILATAVSFPVLAQVFVSGANGAGPETPASVDPIRAGQHPQNPRSRLMAKLGGTLLWVVVAFSFLDYVVFAVIVHNQGTAAFDDPQARAISQTAEFLPEGAAGLVLPDPCIDPFRLKALSGAPTAYYNLGLAWPTHEPEFRALLKERESGRLDQPLADRAGVGYVMIDTGCAANWQGQITGSKVAESGYGNGVAPAAVTLWKIGQ